MRQLMQSYLKPHCALGARKTRWSVLIAASLGSSVALGDGGVTFTDIAAGDGAGITYRRGASPSQAIWDAIKQEPLYTFQEHGPLTPGKSSGNPGVAIFDFDLDGDLDLYVSNGPDRANSLYSNQLEETGQLTFVDVAVEAGVDATDQDSTGVCYGDIDNDGDKDLYVMGLGEPNRLFENQGDGTFDNITLSSQAGAGNTHPSTCSFGDINSDGLLDLVVANSYDNWDHRLPLQLFEFAHLMEPNQVFLNVGDNVFQDISETAGIQTFTAITWSIAIVDYDLDGDGDIILADDQGPKKPAKFEGGKDVGYIRVYQNDGTGAFTDVTEAVGTNRFGAWMGLSFGDLNSDGNMDIFGTNLGDYLAALMAPVVGFVDAGGDWTSSWFLGQDDGSFIHPGIGALGTTPFGWGNSMADYDNDGDTDIIFHGALDMGPFVDASNPGSILQNDGNGNFNRDPIALANSTNHLRRTVHGMAVGDLNKDGFIDIVSASNMDWPEPLPLAPFPPFTLGGQFDDVAFIFPTFTPVDPTNLLEGFTWNGFQEAEGTLSVEINSGDNASGSVTVTTLGAQGLTRHGKVNRDGIGSVVLFKPRRGEQVMKPIVSGGSFSSADSLDAIFGLGTDRKGTVEVLWPGGVRNRLYNVRAGEQIVFPEIPCSFTDESSNWWSYRYCVMSSLYELQEAGIIEHRDRARFQRSALKAFRSHRRSIAETREHDDEHENEHEDEHDDE